MKNEQQNGSAAYDPSWNDENSGSHLVIEDNLRIRWISPCAEELIGRSEFVRIRQNRLSVGSFENTQLFRTLITTSNGEAVSLCLPDGYDNHIVCTAVALANEKGRRLTSVTVKLTVETPPFDGTMLASAFHLTAAEKAIIEAMVAGKTAEQVSQERESSLGTVRVHIRHIYEKLSVNSREALFHKIMPYQRGV